MSDLRDVSPEAIEARLQRLRTLSESYSMAHAEAEYLDEFKKSKLAMLMKKHEQLGHKTTAAQEREARADDEYVALLVSLRTAVEVREKLRWELRIAEAGVGVWQTAQANQRAEANAYRRT